MTWRRALLVSMLLLACGGGAPEQAPTPSTQSRADKARDLLDGSAFPEGYHPWRDQTDAEVDEMGLRVCRGAGTLEPVSQGEMLLMVEELASKTQLEPVYAILLFRAFQKSYCPDLQFERS